MISFIRRVPPFVWAMLCYASFVSAAFADTTDNLGASLTWLQPYVIAVFSSLIMSSLAWLWYLITKWFGIKIEAGAQSTISAWCLRQAASLVASGFVRLVGMKVQVNSTIVARAAELASSEIPAALAHAGLSPQALTGMIIDHLPHVPTIAAVAASQTAAAGRASTVAASSPLPASGFASNA